MVFLKSEKTGVIFHQNLL